VWQPLQKHRDEAGGDLFGQEAIDAWSNWRVQLVQLGTDRTDGTFRIATSPGSLLALIQMAAPSDAGSSVPPAPVEEHSLLICRVIFYQHHGAS
jgi:hypothetical protein